MKLLYTALIILFSLNLHAKNNKVLPQILAEHHDKSLFTKLTSDDINFISLFNGNDLIHWYTYTEMYGINNDIENAFNIEYGILHIAGEHKGYICTNDSYKNYYLRIVFRIGDKQSSPDNDADRSLIQYHFPLDADDRLWPVGIEVTDNDSLIEGWNTVEIICIDNKSEQYINGQLYCQINDLEAAEGKILLSLNGKEVYYKNIDILPLK